MQEYTILIELFLIVFALLPPIYFLYLYVVSPWSYLKAQRKLHGFVGHTWVKTEAGGMAIDKENWSIFIYKINDEND